VARDGTAGAMVATEVAAAKADDQAAINREASFCDSSSIPLGTAASIRRWSKELVHVPPFERLHEALLLQITDQLGMHMLSRQTFDSGDLVLSERAVLRIPELPRQMRDKLERRYGAKSAFMVPGAAVDWASVSEEQREACLNLFWTHPLMTRQRNVLIEDNSDACQDLIEWHAPLRGRCTVQSLMKFLHIVDLNIHKDDEDPSHAVHTGLFVLGSKFTHSCSPNCTWAFSSDGCLQYRALRKISPGEILTFSYIGNGMNLITSTIERRHRLAALWFCCQCSRCTGLDMARRMRCPRCGVCECMPMPEERGVELSMDWQGDRPLRELIRDASTWKCKACGASCPASELPLQAESESTRLVPQAMQWQPDDSGKDMAHVEKLRATAAQTVGTNHWTWVLATFSMLQKWLVRLRGEQIVVIDEARLKKASAALAKWFQEAAPDNSEQRLCCLFLAARLAHNLGDSIQEWGYDPIDPLGDDKHAAKRIAEHGWQLGGDAVVGPEEMPNGGRGLPQQSPHFGGPPMGGKPRQVYASPGWH